jgi:hypothetical protein
MRGAAKGSPTPDDRLARVPKSDGKAAPFAECAGSRELTARPPRLTFCRFFLVEEAPRLLGFPLSLAPDSP